MAELELLLEKYKVLAHVVKKGEPESTSLQKERGEKRTPKGFIISCIFFKAINCITGMHILLVYAFLHTDSKVLLMKGLSYLLSLAHIFPPRSEKEFQRTKAILYQI